MGETGLFAKGTSDIIGAYPFKGMLLYLVVEVKTPEAYEKLVKGLKVNDQGLYDIIDESKLDEREFLQVAKINRVIKRGGLGLFAWSFVQVDNYCKERLYG